MTAPEEAGGPWLDMSRYPDVDPDTVLSPDDQGLLSSALAVDDGALPDAVWEHMLAVVTGGETADDAAGSTEDTDDGAGDPADDGGWTDWSSDPAAEEPAPEADEHHLGHDPGHDWDGGTV